MQIIEKQLSDIKPYGKNPRKNDNAVPYVANSIKEFGFKVPLVISASGEIVAGHTRYKAAKSLGMETVPCIIADDLTPEQIKAFRLADNKVGELAEWDGILLASEMDDIDGLDMADFGFDVKDVLDGFKAPIEVHEDEHTSENKTEEPKAKLGDVYQLGSHRLMCGSSTNADDVKRLMNGAKARMLFTSPPYSDMREYEGGKDLSVDSLSNFIKVYRPYTDYQVVNLGIKRKDGEVVPYWDEYIKKAHEAGYKLMAWNVWDKGNAGSVANETAFVPIYHENLFLFGAGAGEITAEWMMVFGTEFFDINRTVKKKDVSIGKRKMGTKRKADGTMEMHTQGDTSRLYKQMGSVLSLSPEGGKHEFDHPAIFPVGLPSAYIQAFTDECDAVIEPFSGSGTTIIACEQTNRKCYAMELEPKYVDLAIARWEKLTGQKAEKVKD